MIILCQLKCQLIILVVVVCLYIGVSGDDSEEEEEEGGEKVSLKAQQEQLEAEKQALLQNKELVDEVGALKP